MTWEIVAGDFGGTFKATVEELDLSACTAKIKVWRDSTLLIDGKPDAGMTVVYDAGADESYCYYDVLEDEIPRSAAVDGKRTVYDVMVNFTRDGFQEHDLGFKWIVFPPPPEAE